MKSSFKSWDQSVSLMFINGPIPVAQEITHQVVGTAFICSKIPTVRSLSQTKSPIKTWTSLYLLNYTEGSTLTDEITS